jgi:hypothetical protein
MHKVKVPIIFSGTPGFPVRRDGRRNLPNLADASKFEDPARLVIFYLYYKAYKNQSIVKGWQIFTSLTRLS